MPASAASASAAASWVSAACSVVTVALTIKDRRPQEPTRPDRTPALMVCAVSGARDLADLAKHIAMLLEKAAAEGSTPAALRESGEAIVKTASRAHGRALAAKSIAEKDGNIPFEVQAATNAAADAQEAINKLTAALALPSPPADAHHH